MAPFGCVCTQIGRVRDRTDPIDDVVHKQLPSMLAKSKESRVVVEARFRLVRLGNLANLYNIEWVYWKTIYNEPALYIPPTLRRLTTAEAPRPRWCSKMFRWMFRVWQQWWKMRRPCPISRCVSRRTDIFLRTGHQAVAQKLCYIYIYTMCRWLSLLAVFCTASSLSCIICVSVRWWVARMRRNSGQRARCSTHIWMQFVTNQNCSSLTRQARRVY